MTEFEVPDLRDPDTQRAYQDSKKKFTGEDVPAMHLRERLFLQDLCIAASREADLEKQLHLCKGPGPLMIVYERLALAAATVEAFLARQELSGLDYTRMEVTSGD